MKNLTVALLVATAIVGALWYAIGGVALAIGFGALVLIVIVFAAFGLGSWWTVGVMERGAKIALESQVSDDRRDIAQFNSIGKLVHDLIGLSKTQARLTPPEYPALPGPQNGNGSVTEGEFTIGGFGE